MSGSPVEYMDRTRRYYQAQGFERPYVWAHYQEVPFTPLAEPLAASTLTVITTSALYDREATDPRYVASGFDGGAAGSAIRQRPRLGKDRDPSR